MNYRFVLDAHQARERVDRVLARLLSDVSRATVQRWITERRVCIDGVPCRPRDRVGPGSRIDVEPGLPPPSHAEPDPTVVLDVVYEDPHLLVVNKPAGLVVHPARGHASGTLVNALLARPGFARAGSDPLDPEGFLRPGIVHRLDKDTSGLLVVAKDEATREGLKALLASRRVERVYRAITVGVPSDQVVDTLHGRHPRSRIKFSSRVSQGRRATTAIRFVEPLAGGRCALVECRLRTGRTHQIRVHLAEQTRTPVFGDALYGGRPADGRLRAIADDMGRHALHAGVLGFVHPITAEPLRFEAPLPEELAVALRRLRADE